jgi:hypothetical protein
LLTISKKKRKIYDASNLKERKVHVSLSQEGAVKIAKADLAHRLGIAESNIELDSVVEKDFPNTSLGAPVEDEMSAQMISSGRQINLKADGKTYEYRADKYQIRLRGFKGHNYIIES